jgi:hypothetical protein
MRVVLLTTILLLVVVAVHAESPPPAPLSPSRTNAARLRWLQYSMVGGRVVVSSAYYGTNMTLGPLQVGGRRERLQVQINRGAINLRYELTGPDEQMRIELVESQRLRIQRTRTNPPYELDFEQEAGKPLTLFLDSDDGKRQLEGESFWHLYLAEPELVRRHVVPLLEILRPGWQLATTGAAIEDALVQRPHDPRRGALAAWSQLVDRLASPKFAERASAQRELAAAGPIVVPYLQGLDRRRLDAEQAARIRAVIESLSADNEDSADRGATWLSGDEQVWLALAGREEPVKRRTAARQLKLLLGEGLEFDPNADPPARKAQLDLLRARFAQPAAETSPAAAPAAGAASNE